MSESILASFFFFLIWVLGQSYRVQYLTGKDIQRWEFAAGELDKSQIKKIEEIVMG